jgi:beta-lysine 5,6-aminomutase alpha subunit
MRDIGDEVEFKRDGLIQKRANEVLKNACDLLQKVDSMGLFTALSQGFFGDIKRTEFGGKGFNGVFFKGKNYINPFIEKMNQR